MKRALALPIWIWELSFALPSFILFRTLRAILRVVWTRILTNKLCWKVCDRAMLERRGRLLAIMLTAPRWNTHALIGATGPIPIRESVRLEVQTAVRSAQLWSLVFRRLDRSVVHALGTTSVHTSEAVTLAFEPGFYTCTMRYYDPAPNAQLPEMCIDGSQLIAEAPAPISALESNRAARARERFFYRCLAHYVYPMLRLRRWLPADWVKREFLPVGNPETTFVFDANEARQQLHIHVPSEVLATHRVMFTALSRASFPTLWFRVDTAPMVSPPMPTQGFWMIRLQARVPDAPPVDPSQVEVRPVG